MFSSHLPLNSKEFVLQEITPNEKKKSRTVAVIHLTEKTQTQNNYIWITLLPMPLIIFSLKLIKHEFLLELKAHTPGCVSESLGEAGGKPTPLGTAAVVRFI